MFSEVVTVLALKWSWRSWKWQGTVWIILAKGYFLMCRDLFPLLIPHAKLDSTPKEMFANICSIFCPSHCCLKLHDQISLCLNILTVPFLYRCLYFYASADLYAWIKVFIYNFSSITSTYWFLALKILIFPSETWSGKCRWRVEKTTIKKCCMTWVFLSEWWKTLNKMWTSSSFNF